MTGRGLRAAAGPDTTIRDDSLFQVSSGYPLDFGFAIDVAWRPAEQKEETSRTIGVLVACEAES